MSQSDFGNTGGDLRRASRFPLRTPVLIYWTDNKGELQEASGTTMNVSAFGTLLMVDNRPPDGCQIQLTSLQNQTVAPAKVIWTGTTATEGIYALGIELATPDPDFWPES